MHKKAFTLIEILMAVSILLILSAVILGVFRVYDENQALSSSVSNVVAAIERARQLTLFSRDSSQYGVHFDSDKVVLFKGAIYSSSDSNNVETFLHPKVIISLISLEGGGSEVIFKRLSGETTQNGTITLQNRLDSSETRVVTIAKTGLVK